MVMVQVIVVDVEDRDDSVWHNLTPFDGGLSGWRLLWDRWCPIPRFRSESAKPWVLCHAVSHWLLQQTGRCVWYRQTSLDTYLVDDAQ